ncbi:Kinase [Hexamita inflata]|uniref:Kinase n=2 Tax=Hexamita inflata TaxID=28002 RepID=A0AA86PZ67_9EUKA|nr:Kinase [Hexamita inflata]CAI9946837.1 Kinase [Hexamita inflata]
MSGFKKLCKEYEVGDQVGFAGTHGLWAIYNAAHKTTQQPATVWVLDKKQIEKCWFKKDQGFLKKVLDYLRLDACPSVQVENGLQIMERMEEDATTIVFVSQRVVGSLLSFYYQLGDISAAKQTASQTSDPVVIMKYRHLLKYVSPDGVLYGVTSLLHNLAELHEQGVVHGNITPANIVISPTGAWFLCGFGFADNQVSQQEFSGDFSVFFRPNPSFMSPTQAMGQNSTQQSDCFQVVNALYAVFGSKQPHYDFTNEQGRDKMQSGDNLISNVAEKVLGLCANKLWSLTPDHIKNHSIMCKKFWESFASKARQHYCLQLFVPLIAFIESAVREQVTAVQLLNQFKNHSFCTMTLEIMELDKLGAFSGTASTQLVETVKSLIAKSLPYLVQQKQLSSDFIQVSLLRRIVGLLSNKDYHIDLIPLIISINTLVKIPPQQLFLLFEPIVITHTMLAYRSPFPLVKPGPFAAFTGVTLDIGGQLMQNMKPEQLVVRYASPYNEFPLDPRLQVSDRAMFCPVIDEYLNAKDTGVFHRVSQTLYKNLLFFFGPQAGGRSRYLALNFVIGCIACENPMVSSEVLNYLADVVYLLDKSWSIDEKGAAPVKQPIQQKQDPKQQQQINQRPVLDYRKPITSVLTPSIASIIKRSSNGTQMCNALICLSKMAQFYTEEQLSRVLLPAINDALDNIQKYTKSILGFARFTKVVYTRCSPRTVQSLFLPRLTKMCFATDLVGKELDEVNQTCVELFQFFTDDVQKRVNETMPEEKEITDPWFPQNEFPSFPESNQQFGQVSNIPLQSGIVGQTQNVQTFTTTSKTQLPVVKVQPVVSKPEIVEANIVFQGFEADEIPIMHEPEKKKEVKEDIELGHFIKQEAKIQVVQLLEEGKQEVWAQENGQWVLGGQQEQAQNQEQGQELEEYNPWENNTQQAGDVFLGSWQ